MGGGFICNNYIQQYLFDTSGNNNNFDSNQNSFHNKKFNKKGKKSSYILPNNLENHPEIIANKRYSDFNANYDKNFREKNYNAKNKINGFDAYNASFNDTSYINRKSIDNDEINKKITSVYNSSYYNGSAILPVNSKRINNEAIEEKEDINNLDNNILHNSKHNIVMKRIKENIQRSYNNENNIELGNNIFLANKSRGSSFLNHREIDNFEPNTPEIKMDNFENLTTNGKKNLFSLYCNRDDKSVKNVFHYNNLVTKKFKFSFNMNKYCEELLNTINFIRTDPEGFIRYIDYIIKNDIKHTEEGIFLNSQEIDEKIKLIDNYIEMFENTKNKLKEMINKKKLKNFIYNNDLEIILDESNIDYEEIEEEEEEKDENDFRNIPNKLNQLEDDSIIIDDEIEEKENKEISNIIDFDILEESNYFNNKSESNSNNDNKIIIPIIKINNEEITKKKKIKIKKKNNINRNLDLKDDDIANLILNKRKEIKSKYPLNIFKISVIKDIKINILIQITIEEFQKTNNNKTLKEIIFDENYKYLGVSWANEINRNFISICCFA